MIQTLPLLFIFLLGCNSLLAQLQVAEAVVRDSRSNLLEVRFSEAVTVADAQGFRLVGGAARIQRLLGGSGSTTLLFALSDHVLSDDQFNLLYWPQLGDARSAGGRLAEIKDFPVQNQASHYQGSGTLYYVSTTGNDAFKGTTAQAPFRSISKALNLAQPGDYVLLKRGDTWTEVDQLSFPRNGNASNYLTMAAYGLGKKPRLISSLENPALLLNSSFIQIDNMDVHVRDNLYGILTTNNAESVIISNCRVEAVDRAPHSGRTDHAIFYGTSGVKNPIIINNAVSGSRWGISSSGYPYSETNGIPNHQIQGGLIENNFIQNTASSAFSGNDGIQIARGDYQGLIVRKNRITQWSDDGIDTYLGFNLILEYNTLYNPRSSAANAIKCGGVARGGNELPVARKSEGIVVRYNYIYDLDLGPNNHAINTNDGGQGEIYGNIAYDISGSGCQVSGDITRFNIFHNTFINCNYGVSCWTTGNNAGEIYVENNILQGRSNDINANTRNTGQTMKGRRNILVNGKQGGNYRGQDDIRQVNMQSLFVNPSQKDYRLKTDASAVNNGVRASTDYRRDWAGNAICQVPDIGALELCLVK